MLHFCVRSRGYTSLNGHRREKTCLQGFANNTGADQPAHQRRLISAYVVRLSRSVICRLASSESSIIKLAVAEETGLSLAFSEAPKTGYVASRPKCKLTYSIRLVHFNIIGKIGLHF